jgi:hypothetical protein
LTTLVVLTVGLGACAGDDIAVSGGAYDDGDETAGMDESGGIDGDDGATMSSTGMGDGDGDTGDGDGDGDGDGGTGDGDGAASSGDGDGSASGDGDGGTGDGDGSATGDGDGGTGDGDGTASGDGDGTASGDGDGTASGDGDGSASGDGDGTATGDGTSGDGDGTATGDGTTGDGDGTATGDGTTGDGDGTATGDGTTGDGDGTATGDGTTGDGDGTATGDGTTGDGDGSASGDGDGDGTATGDGTSGDGDGTSGDGDGTSGDGDGTTGDGDGDGTVCNALYVDTASHYVLHQEQLINSGSWADTNEAGDQFGAVLAVGNFNGDAYDDLAISATGEDTGGGRVFIALGSAAGLVPTAILTQSNFGANEPGDRFGGALATGDMNDDTFDELAVGIPGEAIGTINNAGGAALFLGSNGGLGDIISDGASGNTIGCGANETDDEFGFAITIADFNADGFDDAVVGIPGEDADAGAICVVAGAANPMLAASGTPFLSSDLFTLAIAQSEAGDRWGEALASGLINPDTRYDLLVGSPGENLNGGYTSLSYGRNDPLAANFFAVDSGWYFTQGSGGESTEADDFSGAPLAVGDYNGDTYDDLIVGVVQEDVNGANAFREGAVLAIPGKVDIMGGPWGATGNPVYQSTVGGADDGPDRFGQAIAIADFDGDGNDDVVVGHPGESTAAVVHGAFTLIAGASGTLGSLGGTEYDGDSLGVDSNENGDALGSAVAIGDFDGDGTPELAVGAPGETPGSDPAAGFVYIAPVLPCP